MRREIFALEDDLTGDRLLVSLDAGRLLISSTVEGRTRLLVVTAGREAGLALARALLAEFQPAAETGRVPRKENL